MANNDFKQIAEELKKSNKINEKNSEDLGLIKNATLSEQKTSFQDEQRFDLNVNLMKEQNSILSSILDKFDDSALIKKDEGKKASLGFLSKFIPKKGLIGLFLPFFKTLFSPKALLGVGKKLLKFVGAPIAAIFAGIDFFKGWEETKGDAAEKIQGAMSNVLSGLTLGLVDSDVINEGFHKLNSWIFDNVTVPMMDFITNFPEKISQIVSNFPNLIKQGFENIKTEFIFPIMEIPLFKDIIDKATSALDFIKTRITDYIINPILNFIESTKQTFNDLIERIMTFAKSIEAVVMNPLETVSNLFSEKKASIKEGFESLKDKFSFFGKDEGAKKQTIKNIQDKTMKAKEELKKAEQKTTNNVITTDNSKTTISSGSDLSTRSDDFVNMMPQFAF